ncbi:prolyl-tRNA synthetase associated domain-containing protein [Ruminococcus sp. OA3]|uniref:prolyl-tRNA synthetase associated domain-containing protein n=1 Tax=Ruminococcus sp. OA3 TaxID=2914164 RepID=UPI001F053198|nr:prolyl-tRNA synthetase associated domain-containing protein [Ruminococcus sp. OA3]MCH1984198.1 prolyl-tRNA synthetase associated domain-containing protein [Ruminococcus sp. OA3]
MTELVKGRPMDTTGRMDKEIRTYDLLEQLEIPFERVDHEALATIDDCGEVDGILGVEICKNLFLCNRQQTDFYLLMLPGSKPFKTKELSARLGVSRLSFAKPEFMEEFLDITPGAVSVMGLMNDSEKRVQLVIDQEVLEHTEVACHPCVNTTSIKLSVRDLLGKFLPAVGHEPVCVKL